MRELYKFIEQSGEFTEENIQKNNFFAWSKNRIENFIQGLFQRIQVSEGTSLSYFDFLANSTLSGEPYPCASLKCRMDKIDNLSRFSAFYADKVFIKSPIDKHINNLNAGNRIDRVTLYVDVLILLKLKPLVLSGIIGFSSEYICLCEDCLKKVVENENVFQRKINDLQDAITEDCLNSITCTIQKDDILPYITIQGAEKYGYHNYTDIVFKNYIPDEVKTLVNKSKKEKIVLSKKEIIDLGLVDHLLTPAIQDLFESNIYSFKYGDSYLTNREFDVEMINLLHSQENRIASRLLSENLFHSVPILSNISINDIVKLRCKEGESFKVYRDSINKLLSNSKSLDQNSIKDFQRDVILPEVNKINLTIKNSKKALLGSVAYDFIFWSASISIGIFSGLLPLKTAPIVGAIGGLNTAKSIIQKVKDCFQSDKTVRNENYYFLWKLLK